MTNLLRAQFIQMTTTRTFRGVTLATILLTLAAAVLSVAFVTDSGHDAIAAAADMWFMPLVFGIMGAAGAFRHGTAITEALAIPCRTRAFISKLVVYSLFTFALFFVLMLVSSGLISVWDGISWKISGGDWALMVLRASVNATIFTALGVAVGTLVRNQAAAICGTFLYIILGSGLLVYLLKAKVFSFTLGGAILDMGLASHGVHSWAVATLLATGWVALLSVAAVFVYRRLDINS